MKHLRGTCLTMCTACAAFLFVALLAPPAPAQADDAQAQASPTDPAGAEFFEKKVRPLLAARCHECHGPAKQKGNLRLDSRAAVLKGGDTSAAVVPGKPDESLLVDAIRYGDTYQMPPKSQLPAEDIATLVEWVRLGAPWGAETAPAAAAATGQGTAGEFNLAERAKHWSFQPIIATQPPDVRDTSWVKNPIDRFILARLEAAGMTPAPPAEPLELLRRVTFDLIGLPPTRAEIDAYLADTAPGAYERVVDRLLASPHYGERWARHWLDLVRYAETCGHEFDFDLPNAYRYRDYLIRAFNDDVPYDQFVLEHVAGDLLPAPRRHPREGYCESIIATGWYFFGEAKHSPVDSRQDEADRIDNQIDVLAKTFLGLTVSCARCHDHKFDAITTNDYYALAGYLQSSRYQQAYIDAPQKTADAVQALDAVRAKRQAAWRAFAVETLAPQLAQAAASAASLTEGNAAADLNGAQTLLADFTGPDYGEWVATGAAFGTRPAVPGDIVNTTAGGQGAAGLIVHAAAHSGQRSLKLQGTLRSPTFEISAPKMHYRLYGTGGKVRLILNGLQLIKDPIYGGLEFAHGGETPHWHAQDTSKWIGQRAYIELIDDGDGYLALEQVVLGGDGPPAPRPNQLLATLSAAGPSGSPDPSAATYQALLARVLADWAGGKAAPAAEAADRAAIVRWLLDQPWADAAARESGRTALAAQLAALATEQQQIEAQLTPPAQAMAMADGTAENERVFVRGNPKTLGDVVPRRFLEALGGARRHPPEQGSGRLELAQQLVAPENPLVARVLVNRLWHHHFGAGLVRSVDDFGVMGQPPTHPELLDYLATQLMHEGWSLKRLHRQIVLSNTYRLSSRPQPAVDALDPLNKLWHRREVRRLEAESIRDALLAVSGRLDETMFGPGVMPHLTPYMTGRGRPGASGPLDGGGRRSIYLAVRRNFLSPLFQAFDYPTPFTTIGRRGSSNVPAQALALMNNPLVTQQAALWARRTREQPNQTAADRVRGMYLTAIGREPDDAELQTALAFVSATDSSASADDAQAWTDLAHVLVNLKEFIFIP
ncbi:MAG: PSD1 and planctomycete cytochrome C domain-containing protein [Pirellulales bacterium]